MPKKSFFAALVLLLMAVVVRADNRGDNNSNSNIVDEIVARVDTAIITRSDYFKAEQAGQNELEQQFPNNWQAKWAERQKETLRGLIDQQLLLEKGKELGITGETQVVKRLNDMRNKMGLKSMDDLEEAARKEGISWEDFKEQLRSEEVAQQVIGQEVGSKLHISNEEALAWYNAHQKDLDRPEEISLSEIMVAIPQSQPNPDKKDNSAAATPDKPLPEDPAKVAEAKAKAEAILEQLRKGAKFEDLVKASSDGPTAADGGRLGNFKRGELVKEYEDSTFSLKPGEYTNVIRTKQGFIILKVNEHRAAGVPPFKDIEERIKGAVYSEKLDPAARAYLTKLRDEAYIDIKPGYVDTGASPNQSNRPVMVPGVGSADAASKSTAKTAKPKKKKKLLVF
jgi:peptidyl-prolyl cis-trans isomerase SurA